MHRKSAPRRKKRGKNKFLPQRKIKERNFFQCVCYLENSYDKRIFDKRRQHREKNHISENVQNRADALLNRGDEYVFVHSRVFRRTAVNDAFFINTFSAEDYSDGKRGKNVNRIQQNSGGRAHKQSRAHCAD